MNSTKIAVIGLGYVGLPLIHSFDENFAPQEVFLSG